MSHENQHPSKSLPCQRCANREEKSISARRRSEQLAEAHGSALPTRQAYLNGEMFIECGSETEVDSSRSEQTSEGAVLFFPTVR
jgi:hypothetical protein